MRPFPRKIDIQSPIRDLRVERVMGSWRIWLTANGDWSLGTFIELDDDTDKIERVTWHSDGTESSHAS